MLNKTGSTNAKYHNLMIFYCWIFQDTMHLMLGVSNTQNQQVAFNFDDFKSIFIIKNEYLFFISCQVNNIYIS